MKKILIVGTSFYNKGAQSMLFVCTHEIIKRYPDAKVYFATNEDFIDKSFSFEPLCYNEETKRIALSKAPFLFVLFYKGKYLIKKILKKTQSNPKDLYSCRRIMKDIDLVVDASGYNIGSKWDDYTHRSYFDNIKIAKKYKIPMVLMPQTFGPFDYSEKRANILRLIGTYFAYPKIIFCRENNGYQYLKNNIGLTNVELSCDLVLQNSSIDAKYIYKNGKYEDSLPPINDFYDCCVGIVPNTQCIKYGNKETILSLYDKIVNFLTSEGINVCIFRHSTDDLSFCKVLFNQHKDNKRVILVEQDFSCFDYSAFVKRFMFVICSRYHGVVNLYKSHVPCIALGWSDKYVELCKLLHQENYYFDIVNSFDANNILNSLNQMIECYGNESQLIEECLTQIQESNCFGFLDDKTIWK